MNRQPVTISCSVAAFALLLNGGCATGDPPDPIPSAGAHHAAHAHPQQDAQPSSHAHGQAHHQAHHGFSGAEEWAKRFDDPARDAWQRPNAVLDALKLRDGMRVADIGAGTGYFAVRLARALPHGTVYGIDIEPDMVRYLHERAQREGLSNLESQLGLPDDPQLEDRIDLVLVVDTYHHMADRSAYFAHVSNQLAPGARIAIVDFKMGELPVGPPDSMKLPAEQIIQEMQAAGYALVQDDRELLPHQVLLVFQLGP